MLKAINAKKTYISFVFFVFSFFFVSPVLSPKYNNEVTIYINWFIPFFDIYFVKYLISRVFNIFKQSIKGSFFLIIIGMFLWVVFFRSNLFIFIKILTIWYSIIYLIYVYERIGFKYLYMAFNINIIIAVIQFILYLKNPAMAYVIGPENIHRILWGMNNKAGNTNFYPIFYFPRTCGLSREAGFFAALLNVVICIHALDNKYRIKRIQKILYFIAYIVSFSKMSLMLFSMYFIYKHRKKIDRLNYFAVFTFIFFFFGIVTNLLNDYGYLSENNFSIAHRLYGYAITFNHLNIKEIIMGNLNGTYGLNLEAIQKFPLYYKQIMLDLTFCGYPSIIINFGFIGLVIFLILFYTMGVTTGGLLFIIFATIDVDMTTATSFVVLAYWCVIYEMRNHKYKKGESARLLFLSA